jgi:hypothetical protein
MNKSRACVWIGTALIIGFVLGWFDAGHSPWCPDTSLDKTDMAQRIYDRMWTLKRFRTDGNADAVEVLEMQLDEELVALGDALGSTTYRGDKELDYQVLRVAKQYRSQFPYLNGWPDTAQRVANALQLAGSSPGRDLR